MALRDQPYLPLYVQDYLTDEKLSMCSWTSQGVYIKLLCLLHKSDPYGTILLKQNDKPDLNFASNFASKIMKLLPIERDVLIAAITELVNEKCLTIEGNKLFQKRMVRDNEISLIRSETGKKGGLKTQKIAKAKVKANTEYEYVYENVYENDLDKKEVQEKEKIKDYKMVFEEFRKSYPGTKRGLEIEYENFRKKNKNWKEILPQLLPSLQNQHFARLEKAKKGGFVPEWKNMATWINQKCWEEEIVVNNIGNETIRTNNKPRPATAEAVGAILVKHFGD